MFAAPSHMMTPAAGMSQKLRALMRGNAMSLARISEFRAHQEREDPADEEEQERVREVEDADLVMVRRREPADQSDRRVPVTVARDDLSRHPRTSDVALLRTGRRSPYFRSGQKPF